MKRLFTFILAIIIAFSMVACGSESTDTSESGDIESTQSTPVPEDKTSEIVEIKTVEDAQKYLPAPPVSEYTIDVKGSQLIYNTQDIDNIIVVSKSDIIEYCNTLQKLGFNTVNVNEEYTNRYGEPKYRFGAMNSAGCMLELDVGFGGGEPFVDPSFIMVFINVV